MLTGRLYHGCGSYFSEEGMVLLVAGGADRNYGKLDSTEILLPDEQKWRTSTPLPTAMWKPSSVSSGGKLFLIGLFIISQTIIVELLLL